jgi:hypothetical protein
MGLAFVVWGGCRNYGALDRSPHDAASLQMDGIGASSPPDLARYSCDAGILCETFDNVELGDEWASLFTSTGMAIVDSTESFAASPSSLEIDAPMITSGMADPGVSHGFTLGSTAIDGVHVREMVYLSKQVTSTVDLMRIASSKSFNSLWLQATATMNGATLAVRSTSGADVEDMLAFPLDTWTCVEWSLSYAPGSDSTTDGFVSAISIGGETAIAHGGITYPFAMGELPDTFVLGDSVSGPYGGATYWIDSLVMTDDGNPIGCPQSP